MNVNAMARKIATLPNKKAKVRQAHKLCAALKALLARGSTK